MFAHINKDATEVIVTGNSDLKPCFKLPDQVDLGLWLKILDDKKIKHGLRYDVLRKLCTVTSDSVGPERFVVARATSPVNPGGIEHKYHFEFAGHIRVDADAPIDYRQRNYGIDVFEGQLLAEQTIHDEGKPGINVHGSQIPFKKAQRHNQMEYNGNVSIEKKGNYTRYYSKIDGVLINDTPGRLEVESSLVINGFVDLKIGNLSTSRNIEIRKDVCQNFSIRSQSDILIEGSVERGAFVDAVGDIEVRGGLTQGAHLRAGGNVHLRYGQGARIEAKGDLIVENYMYDSRVKVGGRVIVKGMTLKGERGALIGGEVCAVGGIKLNTVGSPQALTVLAFGFDMHNRRNLEVLEENRVSFREEMKRTLRHLNLNILASDFAEKVKALPEAEKKEAIRLLKTFRDLKVKYRNVENQKQSVEDMAFEANPEAELRIDSRLFPDVRLYSDRDSKLITGEQYNCVFKEVDGKIVQFMGDSSQNNGP